MGEEVGRTAGRKAGRDAREERGRTLFGKISASDRLKRRHTLVPDALQDTCSLLHSTLGFALVDDLSVVSYGDLL